MKKSNIMRVESVAKATPISIIDLLEAAMTIGYNAAVRGFSIEDATDVGEGTLATAMLELTLEGFHAHLSCLDTPLFRFTPEWWSSINETLGVSDYQVVSQDVARAR